MSLGRPSTPRARPGAAGCSGCWFHCACEAADPCQRRAVGSMESNECAKKVTRPVSPSTSFCAREFVEMAALPADMQLRGLICLSVSCHDESAEPGSRGGGTGLSVRLSRSCGYPQVGALAKCRVRSIRPRSRTGSRRTRDSRSAPSMTRVRRYAGCQALSSAFHARARAAAVTRGSANAVTAATISAKLSGWFRAASPWRRRHAV